MITIHQLLDNSKCFETIRALRWPEAFSCPHCGSEHITKQGKDESQPERQRYGMQSMPAQVRRFNKYDFCRVPSTTENLGAVLVFYGLELIERAGSPVSWI